MPTRDAIIEISRLKTGGALFRLLTAGAAYDDMLDFSQLAIDPRALPPLDTRPNVTAYGDKLFKVLCTNQAVAAELQQIGQAIGDSNLRFWISGPDGELFRWEALCSNPDRFLALTASCTMRRLSGPIQDAAIRSYVLPLRMAAFLSPALIDPWHEFDAIAGALKAARAAGLAIELTAFMGQQAALDRAAAEIAQGLWPGVAIVPLPADSIAMEQAIKACPYQILHFFCHGRLTADVQLLEFATTNDYDTAEPNGSVTLSVERVKNAIAASNSAWMTILNCCSGAAPMPRISSMAKCLAQSACPFVVGMAEPIRDTDANMFASAFYGEAFARLVVSVSGEGTSQVDLGPAVSRARTVLHDAGVQGLPEQFSRWCLPILYEQAKVLGVVALANPEMRKRAETVASALRSLPTGTPDDLRNQLLAILDKDPRVPDALRPDRYGSFA